ncbi:hypothetical protein TNIN_369921 [Trichonephila inaurata madagascariensis]|uniref:Uncharacterized protein n=1 Tax=Trichonephila inaurata madagascariensis TaxID=2747483 RepID=A0A8X6X7X1_9ARAC|nr:hypothetical protein TNIN_64321 [Trichonephila inaurata madagascariensis]GFY48508.1 hypothetical protein TNIN_369921 [Trichonephila inaurata madagascariensis]
MAATLSESFLSDMDWETTEVRVEEMEWEHPEPSLQGKLTSPTSQKGSPFISEFIRHKIRSKPKVSIPEVSAPTDRVILKARRPALPRI